MALRVILSRENAEVFLEKTKKKPTWLNNIAFASLDRQSGINVLTLHSYDVLDTKSDPDVIERDAAAKILGLLKPKHTGRYQSQEIQVNAVPQPDGTYCIDVELPDGSLHYGRMDMSLFNLLFVKCPKDDDGEDEQE